MLGEFNLCCDFFKFPDSYGLNCYQIKNASNSVNRNKICKSEKPLSSIVYQTIHTMAMMIHFQNVRDIFNTKMGVISKTFNKIS